MVFRVNKYIGFCRVPKWFDSTDSHNVYISFTNKLKFK